jgi:16S rRNA (cytidine1402-2'-O)-methyltransferase
MDFKPGLYVVSTPIGNIEDISFRAIETLKHSDVIFCEDSRVTAKLLEIYNIKKKLLIYNDHSKEQDRIKILKLILEGKIISLVSDAGTPLISDPGYKLLEYLRENNVAIDIIPGPCSIIAALILSSLPTDQFYFGGFIPKTSISIRKFFEKVKNLESTLVFFDTARSVVKNLKIAQQIYGDRKSSIVREITKLFQESQSSNISTLIEIYNEKPPKGEIVLVIEGKKNESIDIRNIKNKLELLIKKELSVKDIVKIISIEYPEYKKTQIYKEIIKIKIFSPE